MSPDGDDSRPARLFWVGFAFSLPLGGFVTWLFWRGSGLAVPAAIMTFVVTSPFMAKIISVEEGLEPQEAWTRSLRRGREFVRGHWSRGWRQRIELVAEAPLAFLAVVWFGIGTVLVTGWRRLRGNR